MTMGKSRPRRPVGALLAILIYSLCATACGADDGKRIVVFVQATKDQSINRMIMDKYVWYVYQAVARPGEFFQLEMYPINANTAASTAFFSAAVRNGEFQSRERSAARQKFLTLHDILNKTYGSRESELVDVVGSLGIIDETLGTVKDPKPVYVIYVSDMVQNNGPDGYDFTGYHGGKSLDDCRRHLEQETATILPHRDAFRRVGILVLKLDLRALFRAKGTESEPPPKNIAEIDKFWDSTVFQNLLHAGSYEVSRSQDVQGVVEHFLSYKHGNWWNILGLSAR